MNSQKKSSTKVGPKKTGPTGQRQFSNLLRSQKVVLVEDKSRSSKKRGKNSIQVFESKPQNAPVSKASRLKSGPARQISIPNGGIRIKHIELIGPVFKPTTSVGYADADSTLYQTHRLRINPGSKKTFNWLSTISPNFEFFRFRRVVIHYETRCSTAERGSIIMSPDYDAADGQVAVSEQTLFSNRGTVDDTIWKHLELHLDVNAMNRLYKSHPNMSDDRFESTTQDEKTIDPAQVFILVDSDAAIATKYGKIFIEYEVDLTDPQNPTEPNNLGGVGYLPNILGIANNSSTPITAVQNLASYAIDNNILKPQPELPLVNIPTATVGRFNRDYDGLVNIFATGTGINSNSLAYSGSDANTPAGSVGDVLTALVKGVQNSTSTEGITVRYINAKAGDFLKIATPTAVTLTKFVLDLAGSSALLA